MVKGEGDEEEKSLASSDSGACEDAVAGFALQQQAAKEREGGQETSEAPSQRAKRDQLVAEESCDSMPILLS